MARRVNKSFIVISVVVAGVFAMALGGVAYWKLVLSKNPIPHIQAGDQAMKDGDYVKAVDSYARAIRLKDTDPMIWVKLGDAQNFMAGDDVQNLTKARSVWETAVTQDPRLLEGHRRLLKFWRDFADASTGAARVQYLERERTVANNIIRAAKDDPEANLVLQQTVIDAWLSGQPIDPQKIDDAITALRQLQTASPNNPEIPYTIARAVAQKGMDAYRRNERENCEALMEEATKTMADAVAAAPDSATTMIRQAQLLSGIGPRLEKVPANNEEAARAENRRANKEIAAVSAKAFELAKPSDEEYTNIGRYAANMQQRVGDNALAGDILRRVIEAKPEELEPRLQMVDLLRGQMGNADTALEMLTKAPPPTPKAGVAAQVAKDVERRASLMQADIMLDQYLSVREKGGKGEDGAELLKKADDLIRQVATKEPDSARMLRVQGKLQLFRNEAVGAIQTLNRALGMATDPTDRTRYEIMYLLARAYLMTEQTGEAERLYTEIVQKLEYTPARIELTKLLLRKSALEEAARQIDILESTAPTNPEVVSLRLAWMDLSHAGKDPVEFAKTLAKLPEDTPQRRAYKARMALAGQANAEAVRLFSSLVAEMPKERNLVLLLAQSYEKNNQKDKAIALLEDFVSKNPDAAQMSITLNRLKGASDQQLQDMTLEQVKKIPDAFQRNMTLYDLYRRSGDQEGMKAALDEVVRIAPDNIKVIEIQYQWALSHGDLATAEKLIEPLSKIDNADGKLIRARYLQVKASTETDPDKRVAAQKEATEAALDLTQTRGEFAEAWVVLGQAYQSSGRFDEALTAYNQALNRQPQNEQALEGMIRCNYMKKLPAETKRYIDQAQAMFPKNQTFIEYLVSWEVMYGDARKIIPIREKNLTDNPEVARAYGNLASAYAAAARSASSDEAKDLNDKSRDVFAKGVAKFPDDINLTAGYAELCQLTGRFDEGLKAWMQFLKQSGEKESPDIITRVGAYYRSAGKIDEAIAFYNEKPERLASPQIRVDLAELYLAKGDQKEAEKQLVTAGNDPRAIQRYTELLLATNRPADAQRVAEEALKSQPDSVPLMNRLAFVYLSLRKDDLARGEISKVQALDPRNMETLLYSALLDVRTGQIDRALQTTSVIIEAQPENPDALKLRADLYRQRNNVTSASDDMEAVLRVRPADKATRVLLIELYIAMQPPRIVDAERLVREGQKIESLKNDPDLAHAEARVLYAKKDYTKAIERILVVLKAKPDNLAAQDTYFRVLMSAGQYPQVIQATTRLLETVQLPWVYSTRASAFARQKDKDKALADFDAGFKLAIEKGDQLAAANTMRALSGELGLPEAVSFLTARAQGNDTMKVLLAQMLAESGKIDDAVTTAEQVMQHLESFNPAQRLTFLKFFGGILLGQQPPNVQRAKEIYAAFIKEAPNDYEGLNNMAYLLLLPESGASPSEALQYAERSFAEMRRRNVPDDAMVMDTYGTAMVRGGRVAEGINMLREALNRTQFAEGYVHLAEGFIKNEQLSDASAALDTAQQLMDADKAKGVAAPEALQKKYAELRQSVNK